ncbi:hypothetical protein F8271_27795 [Micromonospora sp. ALFpr18c]|uniref:hypothetical protein n=1 Tax=unclassified Micromonospora TaxID=2617518 RepID=UPI00124B4F9F|nr:hypothetical protein [Micromonospora sp. ALFpr18c]KAB1930652.1 hypothetical protein F8271_27795 [Micromonospora sp. ALFpr18c]
MQVPPLDSEPMVPRGVRLPVSIDARVEAAAKAAGVKPSTWIRQCIEVGLTEQEHDRPVSLAALRRAIAHATQESPRAA